MVELGKYCERLWWKWILYWWFFTASHFVQFCIAHPLIPSMKQWSKYIWNVSLWNSLHLIEHGEELGFHELIQTPFRIRMSFKHTKFNSCLFAGGLSRVVSSTFSLSLSKTWSLLRTFHHLNVFFTWFLARSLYPSLHCILLFTFTLVYSRSHRISGLIYCTIIPNWFLCLFTPQEIYLRAYPMILP